MHKHQGHSAIVYLLHHFYRQNLAKAVFSSLGGAFGRLKYFCATFHTNHYKIHHISKKNLNLQLFVWKVAQKHVG